MIARRVAHSLPLALALAIAWLPSLVAGSEYDLWLRQNVLTSPSARVMVLIDTSPAMNAPLASRLQTYDPAGVHAGVCDEGSIYFTAHEEPGDRAPDCAAALRIQRTRFDCPPAAPALAGTPGVWSGRALGFESAIGLWHGIVTGTPTVRCFAGRADTDPTRSWSTAPAYSAFDGGWLDWASASPASSSQPGIEVVRASLSRWLTGLAGIEVGFVQSAGQGAPLVHALSALPGSLDSLAAAAESLQLQGAPDWPAAARATRAAFDSSPAARGSCLLDQVIVIAAQAFAPNGADFGAARIHTLVIGTEASPDLERLARSSGGLALEAHDEASLELALHTLTREVLLRAGAHTRSPASPSAGISFAGRDHYVTTFEPSGDARWSGNLRKYRLRQGIVVDATNTPIVDPDTGTWQRDSRSLWSRTPDGGGPLEGGAAHRLPAPDERRLYTWLGANATRDLASPANGVEAANERLDSMVFGEPLAAAERDTLISWLRGADIDDTDADGDRTEARQELGAIVRGKPAIVRYDAPEGAAGEGETLVFAGSDDGILHAFDARSGRERWAYMPPAFLAQVPRLRRDRAVAAHSPALDGPPVILRFDANADGRIEPGAGDRVWLYFGARGAPLYTALDVTEPDRPRLLWQAGPAELPSLALAWSTPVLTRLRIEGSAQNAEHLVLVAGGGYAPEHDWGARPIDARGHRLYVIDAASGALLWFAGARAEAQAPVPDLPLESMTSAIASPVSVVDLDGDEYADRLYVGDLGGRVWRIDFHPGRSRSSLASGSVLAALGQGGQGPLRMNEHRQFFEAPDVALFTGKGSRPFLHLGLGSGSRSHPLSTEVDDRYYALRDPDVFARRSQAEHDLRVPVRDADLPLATSPGLVPDPARGWKLALDARRGEKILARPLTLAGLTLFTSWSPGEPDPQSPCAPPPGVNHLYALDVQAAAPALDLNDDGSVDTLDIRYRLEQESDPQEVRHVWEMPDPSDRAPSDAEPPGTGSEAPGAIDSLGRRSVCMVGVQILKHCIAPQSVLRTYWQREGVDASLDDAGP